MSTSTYCSADMLKPHHIQPDYDLMKNPSWFYSKISDEIKLYNYRHLYLLHLLLLPYYLYGYCATHVISIPHVSHSVCNILRFKLVVHHLLNYFIDIHTSQTNRQTGRQAVRQINSQTKRQSRRQTERQTDRQSNIHMNGQTKRQTKKQTGVQANKNRHGKKSELDFTALELDYPYHINPTIT